MSISDAVVEVVEGAAVVEGATVVEVVAIVAGVTTSLLLSVRSNSPTTAITGTATSNARRGHLRGLLPSAYRT